MEATRAARAASPLAIWAGMLTIYIVWGSTYLAIRFAVETIPPFIMAATRFLVAGSVLLLIRRLSGDPFPSWQEIRPAAIMGWFLLLGGNGGVVWAEQFVPSGITALVVGTVPLWMVLIDALHPKSPRPHRQAVLGVVVGFIGIGLLFWPDPNAQGRGRMDILGILVLLGGSVSWAYGSIYSKHVRLPSSPMMATSIEMLAGGLGLLVLSILVGEPARLSLSQVSTDSVLGLVYLIVFGSLVGFAAYTWLLRVAPTSLVSTYAYVNPLVAIVLGTVIGDEILSPQSLLAATVILGAVIVVAVGQRRPARGKVQAPSPVESEKPSFD